LIYVAHIFRYQTLLYERDGKLNAISKELENANIQSNGTNEEEHTKKVQCLEEQLDEMTDKANTLTTDNERLATEREQAGFDLATTNAKFASLQAESEYNVILLKKQHQYNERLEDEGANKVGQ